MKMIFRNGERSDSAGLIEMRMEYLKEDWGTLTEEQETAIRKQLPDYMERHLGGNLTAYVAEENGRLAGTVLMMVVEKLAGPSAINGKTGTLMNVYVRVRSWLPWRWRMRGGKNCAMSIFMQRCRGRNCTNTLGSKSRNHTIPPWCSSCKQSTPDAA